MRRREFVGVMGSALAAPKYVIAQPAVVHRVAWLSLVDKEAGAAFLNPFVEGMAALGYQLGRNLMIDARYGDDSREKIEREAIEAAVLKPVLYATQGPALHAARKVAGETPVVFGFSGDPVLLGVAKSLARPGGNYTGVTLMSYDLAGKRVELMREILPKLKRLAVLSNPHHMGDMLELEATQEAAKRYRLDLSHYPVSNAAEVERALQAIAAARAEAILAHPDGLMVRQGGVIAQFAIKHRIPAISGWARFAEGGNLLTYGPNMAASYGRLAYFADRILRGTKPADLPVELPSKLEMVINLKSAKALGLTVPQSVLLRADRVIE